MKGKLFSLLILLICLACSEQKSSKTPTICVTETDSLNEQEPTQETDSLYQQESTQETNDTYPPEVDSFVVKYRQKVHGYKVKAVVRCDAMDMANEAKIYFTKGNKTFMLYSSSFGDTCFNKGYFDSNYENEPIVDKYRGKTIVSDYKIVKETGDFYPESAPFFFQDLDFDGIAELVIPHKGTAVKYHDCYDIYRIIENTPILIDYEPYKNMTDYPEFDFKTKTISCPYPEGSMRYDGITTYGVSKTQKDVILVNGKKHYLNKIVIIRDKKFKPDLK